MSRNQFLLQRGGSQRSQSDGDNSSRFAEEDYGYGKERAQLSPVSEDPHEVMDDEEAMMYDMMEAGVPAPPDGGWGWVVVFASFMCNLIVDGIAYTFGVFFAEYATAFIPPGEGTGKVAWVGSLLSGVYLTVGPIVSALTNKFGCRVVCIAGHSSYSETVLKDKEYLVLRGTAKKLQKHTSAKNSAESSKTCSFVASAGFALSSLSPNLEILMLTYGVVGGIGFGLIYLPAVVCVGYYFESKRALATGIAVCGSGVGTFVFAPFARWLIDVMGWRNSNLVFAGLIFNCAIFGALMKPLEVAREAIEDDYTEDQQKVAKNKPLLLRMAEDKRNLMEKGSLAGSAYFMVQLPDGTMEKRMKLPLNVDPGVHSSFNLDQLVPGTPINPNPTLPTITEAKATDGSVGGSDGSQEGSGELKSPDSGSKLDKADGDQHGSDSNSNVDDASRPLMSTTPAIPIPIPEAIAEERETDGSLDSVDESQLSSSALSAHRRTLRERRNSEGVNSGSPSSIKQSEMYGKSPTRIMPQRSGSIAVPLQYRMGGIPRNGSAPQFTPGRSIPKNVSVPLFDRTGRKHSYRAVPIGSVPRPQSKSNLSDSRRGSTTTQLKTSMVSILSLKNNNVGNQDDDYSSLWSRGELSEGLIFSTSQRGQAEGRHIIRPMSRKDIFYSGSIAQLPEFTSQKSINSYRQSVINLPRAVGIGIPDDADGDFSPRKEKPSVCPCLFSGAGAFKTALAQLMDFSLLKNPVFLFIAVSNVFGMLGFYVPFVYIIQSAEKQGVGKETAAFLLSIIGITNTIGRVACGLVSDLPQVNSLFLNNMCILLSGLCVGAVPFCTNEYSYIAVAIFFGLFVSGYVSLTSIILVDLLGLDCLTNAFGLLILFRGAASMVGAPLAGAVYDAFQRYDVPFFIAGGFLVISALISFLVPFVKRFAPEKKILEPQVYGGYYLEDIPEAAESSHNNSTELENSDQVESCV